VLKSGRRIFRNHITLADYEIHNGDGLELFYVRLPLSDYADDFRDEEHVSNMEILYKTVCVLDACQVVRVIRGIASFSASLVDAFASASGTL
jgi:hypothetical protein